MISYTRTRLYLNFITNIFIVRETKTSIYNETFNVFEEKKLQVIFRRNKEKIISIFFYAVYFIKNVILHFISSVHITFANFQLYLKLGTYSYYSN